jgi:hypothetical protein
MKQKKLFFRIALIFILFCFFFSTINVFGIDYNIDVKKDDKFVWKITKLDSSKYENIFYPEKADFKKDDQKKFLITEVDKSTNYWKITYDFWKYTDNPDDFSKNADQENKVYKIYKNPKDQAKKLLLMEDIIGMWVIPTPYINYIEELRDHFDHPLIVLYIEDDTLIAKYSGTPEVPAQYEIEITYDINGVLKILEYFDQNGETFLKIELLEENAIFGYDILIVLGVILVIGLISVIFLRKKIIIYKE